MVRRADAQLRNCEFESNMVRHKETIGGKATGNRLIRFHFPEKTRCAVSDFCYAWNRSCSAAYKIFHKIPRPSHHPYIAKGA